jgi:N-acylneuraminate cytidylyltransferase
MSNICIITARGGSKRIPRKNIRDFLGKPIIAYSIEAAINSCLFDEVMVSTDDEEIKLISEKYGAKVPFMRTSLNSNDYSTTVDVLAEVLNKYSELGKFFNTVCCLYPTAPFVTSSVLLQAYKMLTENTFDCVFPVIQYSFPIQRALRLSGKNNNIEMFYPEYLKSRSQDLEKSYHDCGQYYFFKPEIVLKKNKLYTNNTGAIIIDEFHSQDIDNEIDWKLAEVKFKLLNGQA